MLRVAKLQVHYQRCTEIWIPTSRVGVNKYLDEIWRKKQSDILRFFLQLRASEYRQGEKNQGAARPTRTDKAHKLVYKAKLVISGYDRLALSPAECK